MLVFALILLFFFNHQPPSILIDTSYTADLADGNYPAVFLVGMFMALFVVYGFDTAGTFGEETVDAEPPGAARRPVRDLALRHRRRHLPAGGDALVQGRQRGGRRGPGLRLPDRDHDQGEPDLRVRRDRPLATSTSFVILIAVYVCTLAIQGATARLMFSMGRDRRLPFGGTWGHVNPTFRTPANAAIAVGVLAAIPFFADRRRQRDLPGHRGDRDDLHQLLPVQPRRPRRPPHGLAAQGRLVQRSGSWGTVINILALVWGAVMIINIGLWTDPALFGVFGERPAHHLVEPVHQHFLQVRGQCPDRAPALADLRDRSSASSLLSSASSTTSRPSAARSTGAGRGRRRDRRGDHRLSASPDLR